MSFSNKTVVITGASRGIGEAAAYEFANKGANVALLARSEDAITTVAKNIGSAAIAIPCDVASYASVQSACDRVKNTFGQIDILINNAGVVEPISHIATSSPEHWGEVIDINLKGVYYGMRAVLPDMLARGEGTILTISSGAAHSAIEGWSHYCASKAGAAMLTDMVHAEYGNQGIRAIGLSPGTVATQMQKEIKASGINPVSKLEWSDHIPPEWPARTLAWLAGPDGQRYAGQEVSLRDTNIRNAVGLT
jgi:NAD(P)-dependent dehydrogenase (short-subunit alcohol dehydrogenase family)